MHTTLYQSPQAFTALADEWNALLHRSSTDVPFLTLEWQSTWWQHFGYSDLLLLYASRDEAGALCGIAPLFRNCETGRRELNTVGCADVSDYLDMIVAPGCEQTVFGALLDALAAQATEGDTEWDSLDLCNIPEASPTREALSAAARARGWHAESSLQEVCPIIHLP